MARGLGRPLFILGPPRSFKTVTCAMLGQHPDLYGLPELNLFLTERVTGWLVAFKAGRAILGQGLLRAIAEVVFGGQDAARVAAARAWLLRRARWSTPSVFNAVAGRVRLTLVEKSPLNCAPFALERVGRAFPRAMYLHLLRHPRTRGESAARALQELGLDPALVDHGERWYVAQKRISDYLSRVPPTHQLRLRGEDLLSHPDPHLRQVATWLGISAGPEAIEAMKHPERSPFASFGPPNAPYGYPGDFLKSPALRALESPPPSLDGPVGWRTDGADLPRRVKELARTFGYE
jgi:hypothetical protein